MAENIIITPDSGKFDFYDSGSTLTTLVIESGALKFKRSGTTYLELSNTSPQFKVNSADLKVVTNLINASGNLISSAGWLGAAQPTGPIGAQGAQGAQGPTGGQGAQGSQGGQGAQGGGGAVGPQGAQGPAGTGAQGAQGPAGGQGAQGGPGAQGAQGGGGAVGPQGAQGPAGTGPQGAQGAQGGQGAQGTVGGGGPQGAQGAQGPAGTNSQGAQGAQGAQGGGGGASPGPTGAQGSQGGAGPTGPTGPSDSRLKKNVRKIESPLGKVKRMRGVSFIWNNSDPNSTSHKDIGFIAQEIQHVFPELVYKPNDKPETMYMVKYPDIIALCLEAIKEQSDNLDLKESKLEKLEIRAKEKGLI